jgi:hypothetical protein
MTGLAAHDSVVDVVFGAGAAAGAGADFAATAGGVDEAGCGELPDAAGLSALADLGAGGAFFASGGLTTGAGDVFVAVS